jgi:hypothetical protein
MSRPSRPAANIPRLLDKLSSGNARDAMDASKALAALVTASQPKARRLAQDAALPALVQALGSPDDTVATHAGNTLAAVAVVAPDLVADAAGSALMAVLRGGEGRAGGAAAGVRAALAMRRPVVTGRLESTKQTSPHP